MTGRGHQAEVEFGQHVLHLLAQPCAARRGDHRVAVIRQRRQNDVMVVREHRDLVLRGGKIALQQQVLQRALQTRHFLGQPRAAVCLGRALGLRHVIDEIHRAKRRGKCQQEERHRELERRRNAKFHFDMSANGCRRKHALDLQAWSRSSFASTIRAISRRPVTAVPVPVRSASSGFRRATECGGPSAPPGIARRSSAGGFPCVAPRPPDCPSCSRARRTNPSSSACSALGCLSIAWRERQEDRRSRPESGCCRTTSWRPPEGTGRDTGRT